MFSSSSWGFRKICKLIFECLLKFTVIRNFHVLVYLLSERTLKGVEKIDIKSVCESILNVCCLCETNTMSYCRINLYDMILSEISKNRFSL